MCVNCDSVRSSNSWNWADVIMRRANAKKDKVKEFLASSSVSDEEVAWILSEAIDESEREIDREYALAASAYLNSKPMQKALEILDSL